MTSAIITESECKKLAKNEYSKQYSRSREGLVAKIYKNQRLSSRLRNHPMPDYDLEELRAWMFKRPNFDDLFQNWEDSGFDKIQVPSCDRLNDYQPYTLDNLRLVTWAENHARWGEDAKAGINNKNSKAVIQMTKDGNFVAEHHSVSHASRVTGVDLGLLSSCCNGKRKSAGGFVWRFSVE